MRRWLNLLLGLTLLFGFHSSVYASDWDVAGKVLTGIAGLRILTAGKVDIIGAMTGVGSHENREGVHKEQRYNVHNRSRRIWVPDYVWKKKWVPQHREYDRELGTVIVEGHYAKYKVQVGGHWEYIGKNKKHSRFHH